jgi:3-oxoacyl-[acyl-carrier-protein] synthase II
VRIAHASIAAGQSELTLVGGAYNGARWDVLLIFEQAGALLKAEFSPIGSRGNSGGMALGNMGAFLVLESRKHAEARSARAHAKIKTVRSDRAARQPGDIEATLRRQWESIAAEINPERAAVISGASGLEPATSAEHSVLKDIGLPIRNTGTYIGHGVEAQFVANLALACAAIEHGKLYPAVGPADEGAGPSDLSQVVVTGVANWRGEGLALIERTD